MVSPSQDLPSNAKALFHDFQSLLPRERKFKPDRRPQRETLDGKERVVLAVHGRVARRGALAFVGRSGRGDIDHGDELWGGTRRTVGIEIGERRCRIGAPLYTRFRRVRARARARGVVVVMTHDGRRNGDRGHGRGVPVRSGSAAPVQGGAEPAQVVVHPEDKDEQE